MSVISEKIRTALYTKLNVSGVTSLCNGVFFKVAPDGTARPFVVFDRVPGNVDRALNATVVGEGDLWMIKALVDEDTSGTSSPETLAENILAACETAINNSLTITGATVSKAWRRNDIPSTFTDQGDRRVWQFGFFLDVYAG